jgi:hypothetical protein
MLSARHIGKVMREPVESVQYGISLHTVYVLSMNHLHRSKVL